MAAGATQLPILDGTATSRNVLVWSSTGLIGGNLSPLQGILGGDGLNIASSGNGFPITVENTSIAVTGTFFQTTQPISAASLPLPSGAATAAKQPALGTAGTPSTDVLTVQGATSMTALTVTAANAALKTGQQKVATTGTQVQLTSGSNALVNGVTVKSSPNNAAAGMTVGLTGVTNTVDGTGNGYILFPGDSIFIQVTNTNLLFINGTTGDIVAFGGN